MRLEFASATGETVQSFDFEQKPSLLSAPDCRASLPWSNLVKWLVPCLLAVVLPVLAQTGTPAATSQQAVERNVAGIIELIEGDVRVLDAERKPRSVARGQGLKRKASSPAGMAKFISAWKTADSSAFVRTRGCASPGIRRGAKPRMRR